MNTQQNEYQIPEEQKKVIDIKGLAKGQTISKNMFIVTLLIAPIILVPLAFSPEDLGISMIELILIMEGIVGLGIVFALKSFLKSNKAKVEALKKGNYYFLISTLTKKEYIKEEEYNCYYFNFNNIQEPVPVFENTYVEGKEGDQFYVLNVNEEKRVYSVKKYRLSEEDKMKVINR